jgi:hypothetical protein
MGNVTKEGAISRYTTIQEKKQRDTELLSVINHTTTKKYKAPDSCHGIIYDYQVNDKLQQLASKM